jgi:hypothetical protein
MSMSKDSHRPKILVIRSRDRLYAGWMFAEVGMPTEYGRVTAVTRRSIITLSPGGIERRWMKHTSGWPCVCESSARGHGWPSNAGRYVAEPEKSLDHPDL